MAERPDSERTKPEPHDPDRADRHSTDDMGSMIVRRADGTIVHVGNHAEKNLTSEDLEQLNEPGDAVP